MNNGGFSFGGMFGGGGAPRGQQMVNAPQQHQQQWPTNGGGSLIMQNLNLSAAAFDRDEDALDELKESLLKERATLEKYTRLLEEDKKQCKELEEKLSSVNMEVELQGKRFALIQNAMDEHRTTREKVRKDISACADMKAQRRDEFQKRLVVLEQALRAVHKENSPEALTLRLAEAEARLESAAPWIQRESELEQKKREMQSQFESSIEAERQAKRALLCANLVEAMQASGNLTESGGGSARDGQQHQQPRNVAGFRGQSSATPAPRAAVGGAFNTTAAAGGAGAAPLAVDDEPLQPMIISSSL